SRPRCRRRPRHAASSGRARLRALVRRSARGHAGPAGKNRRRSGAGAMIVLGLTGSIGMGKSTTARMFMDEGVPVHDSDEAVHRLYAGAAAPLIEARFPGTVVDGAVDRERLGRAVLGDRQALRDLETIVHPLVRADADTFL